MHFYCWIERHSDPTEEWPPGHECAIDDDRWAARAGTSHDRALT